MAWIVFVVMAEGSTGRMVEWENLKWIVYNRTRTPVKVRTSSETLGPLGRKQCCFMQHNQCDASRNAGVCGSRRRAMRMVTLPSSVSHPNYRAETAARKERTALTQAANESAMVAAMASRALPPCPLFGEGRCLKGYLGNRPCQRKHGTNPEAVGCWYNEAFGDVCAAQGCPYNHTFPNAVRSQRREEAAAATILAAGTVEPAAPPAGQQAPAGEAAVVTATAAGATAAWQPTTPSPPAGTPSGTPPREAPAREEEQAGADMQV